MQAHQTRLKSDLLRLGQELASGQHADISREVRGEFSTLAAMAQSVASLESHARSASETAILLESAQIALGTLQDVSADTAPSLISAGNNGHPALLQSSSSDARQNFDSVVAAINVRVADRSVFAGMATDRSPIVGGPEQLAEIKAVVSGLSDVSDVITAIDDWFMLPGGGFETFAYQGSQTALAPIPVSETEGVQFKVTAENMVLRRNLMSLALGALATDLPQITDRADQQRMMRLGGETLLTSQTDLAILRADVGALEAQTDQARARSQTALSVVELRRSALYEADPYQTATELELAQAQLEAVYTLTARISRLSLADFLR